MPGPPAATCSCSVVTSDRADARRIARAVARTARDPRSRAGVWALPALIACAVIVLTALGVSGTSISNLAADPVGDRSVVAGAPRAIRTDEWVVRTPLVIGQVERGFEQVAEVGVGEHDMSVLYDLPTTDWSTLFRPQLWGYFVLPVANGFAFEWWMIAAVLVLGAYAFVLALVRDWRWAAVGALALYAAPFWHWWYLPGVLATTGWMLAGGAALLAAWDRRGRGRWVCSALAGASFTCAAFLFYPPFQIVLAAVVGATLLGVVVTRLRADRGAWRSLIGPAAIAFVLPAVVFGAFVLGHAEVFRALADAAYPGRRVVAGGDGPVELLGSGWFGWAYAHDPDRMRGVVLANESEASSFLFLGLAAFLAIPFLVGTASAALRRFRWALGLLAAVLVVLLGHLLVGLPSLVTRVTMLSRVPSRRVVIGLGVGSMLALVVVGVVLERTRVSRPRRVAITGAVAIPTALGAFLVGLRLHRAGAPIGTVAIVVTTAVALTVAVLYVWRPLAGATALVIAGRRHRRAHRRRVAGAERRQPLPERRCVARARS